MKLYFSEPGIDTDVFLEELADADDTVNPSEPPPQTPPPPPPSSDGTRGIKKTDETERGNDVLP